MLKNIHEIIKHIYKIKMKINSVLRGLESKIPKMKIYI